MVYIPGLNNTIDTGETYFSEIVTAKIQASTVAKDKLSERANILKVKIHGGQPLEARIEFSRWIVDCPNCKSAEYLFEDKLFLCSQCRNSDVGGEIRRVKLPPERKRIEDILSKRFIINRHWFPNETTEDLENENKAHGLEV